MAAKYHMKYRKVVKEANDLLTYPGQSDLSANIAVTIDCDVDLASDYLADSPPMTARSSDNFVLELDGDIPPFSSSDEDNVEEPTDLRHELASWVVKSQVNRQRCNELLSILRNHGCQLPSDSRTLLRTPRSVQVDSKCGGQFAYFGLHKVLQQATLHKSLCLVLNLQVNIDGIPLHKSSTAQFWPIICSVNGGTPMMAALYFGHRKPNSIEDFTEQFVEELKSLQKEGFSIDGKTWSVVLHSIICDAPARAMMKNIKAHNSLHGCERCIAKGTFVERRTTYSTNACFIAEKRTDEKFASLQYTGSHQIGHSSLARITDECISRFPLDYMHLVCLGVLRRILQFFKKGDRVVRLGSRQLVQISEHLVSLRDFIPSEFARRPRSIVELDRWKATELRQFLLYTGPVVLKDVLTPQLYQHFLALSVSMSIFITQDQKKRNSLLEYGEKLLACFVKNCTRLYGNKFLVYNVHSLLHLADDIRFFNVSLDEISAFPFENYLQTVKKFIRLPTNPIAQVVKRIQEYQMCCSESRSLFKSKHQQIKLAAAGRDSVVQLKSGKFARVVAVTDDIVVCDVFKQSKLQTFFKEPCPSDVIDVYFHSDHFECTERLNVKWCDIERKALRLPYKDGYVIMPLRHDVYN
jgi:hypothetical protein